MFVSLFRVCVIVEPSRQHKNQDEQARKIMLQTILAGVSHALSVHIAKTVHQRVRKSESAVPAHSPGAAPDNYTSLTRDATTYEINATHKK